MFTGRQPAGINYGAITPQDAYNIDSKLDDGTPSTGNVMAAPLLYTMGNDGDCLTHVFALPTAYVATGTKITCSLAFAAGF